MIPIGESSKQKVKPWLTWLLIVVNAGVFVFTFFIGKKPIDLYIQQYGFEPAKLKSLNPNVYLSILSCLFLHGSLMHILGNMVFLKVFGPRLELVLGKFKFIQFYLLAGIVATLSHAAFQIDSQVPLIGASGAISGLMGAYLLIAPFQKINTVIPLIIFFPIFEIPAFIWICVWVLLQFVQASAHEADVAWWAHIGGFIGGAILLLFYKIRSVQFFK